MSMRELPNARTLLAEAEAEKANEPAPELISPAVARHMLLQEGSVYESAGGALRHRNIQPTGAELAMLAITMSGRPMTFPEAYAHVPEDTRILPDRMQNLMGSAILSRYGRIELVEE